MPLPGPNQTGVADRRPRALPSERLAMERPLEKRNIKQAVAAGLKLDPAARQAGYVDGLAGLWRLSVDDVIEDRIDVLAYASGWLEGRRFGRNNGGG